MKKLVVQHHNPVHRISLRVGLLAFAVLSGWGLFEYGRARSGLDFNALRAEAQVLSDHNERLNGTIGELKEQRAILERSQQVEREAYKQQEGAVAALQGEILELKGELAFYRGIVTPANSSGGLRVQTFDVASNGIERGYRYKLVLTQVLKNDRVVRGRAEVAIEGSQDGRVAVVNLAELIPGRDFKFRFKYFQNFEGNFQLPAGFSPQRVTVRVNPQGRRPTLEKVFNWPA